MSESADDVLTKARAFAEPFLAGESLDTGENVLAHADAVSAILDTMNSGNDVKAATYLVYACPHLNRPQEVIAKTFGTEFALLAVETTKLVEVQRISRSDSKRRKRSLRNPMQMSLKNLGQERLKCHRRPSVRRCQQHSGG